MQDSRGAIPLPLSLPPCRPCKATKIKASARGSALVRARFGRLLPNCWSRVTNWMLCVKQQFMCETLATWPRDEGVASPVAVPFAVPALPAEIWVLVIRSQSLSASGLLTMGSVCSIFREAAEEPEVWQSLVRRDPQLWPVLVVLFGGDPPPPNGLSWKRHFFVLRRSWKQLAQQRTNRLLVQVGTQTFSGRAPYETPSLSSLWAETHGLTSTTYGIYDVTAFADHHPGIDLEDAAKLPDATHLWEMNAHSDSALRVLRTLAVPGLERLPYDGELELARRLCHRSFADSFWLPSLRFAVVGACMLMAFRAGCLDSDAIVSDAVVVSGAVVGSSAACTEGPWRAPWKLLMLPALCGALYLPSPYWRPLQSSAHELAQQWTARWKAAGALAWRNRSYN